jgi:hypothetical protein
MDGAVEGDLATLGYLNALTFPNWATQFDQDYGKMLAASRIVRADLGLPPAR